MGENLNAVDMTEQEFNLLIEECDFDDWDFWPDYFDFVVKSYSPLFLVKAGLYSNIEEAHRDKTNFPDGHEWIVVLRLFNDGVAECDIWSGVYKGEKQAMRIRLNGTCVNAIRHLVDEIKEEQGLK
jgi:hypothetical protein